MLTTASHHEFHIGGPLLADLFLDPLEDDA